MQLKIVNGYVDGFAEVGGIENGIEYTGNIPDGFRENCRLYKFIDGALILDDKKVRAVQDISELRNELQELLTWFEWYDIQICQYQRRIRENKEFDQNVVELDQEADIKQLRIREIRNLLNNNI